MTDRTLTLIQDNGEEIICDILFTYFYEKTNKNYVVFQVRDSKEVSAAVYFPENGADGRLEKIETEDEWTMLEDLLNDYANNAMEDEGGCSGSCGSCGGCSGECDCDGECDCE